MKLKSLVAVSLPAVLFFTPILASAAVSFVGGGSSNGGGFFGISFGNGGGFTGTCNVTICGIGGTILFIINSILVPVLFAVAFIMFLYGVAKAYIFSHGNEEAVADGHRLVLWGVVGFAVMLSLWGLVNVVANTFGLSGYSAPPLPTSPNY